MPRRFSAIRTRMSRSALWLWRGARPNIWPRGWEKAMFVQKQLSRRHLLRNLGISAAAVAGSGAGLVTIEAAQHVHNAVAQEKSAGPKGEYAPKCFTAHEFKTLRRLSDLIIPADDHSAGALEAGAAE